MATDEPDLWSRWDPWSFIPTQYNLGVALTRGQVERGHGGRPALLWENAAGECRTLTYLQLDALSARFASSLAQRGVGRGDRVFLRLPNVPEFYVAALAVAKLGAVFIPSSTQFRSAEVAYRLQDSAAIAAVTTSALAEAIDQACPTCPTLRHVIVLPYPDRSASAGSEHLDFATLIERGTESFVPTATRHDEPAFIAYTSGTTGDPKGVVHLQRYPAAYEGLIRFWHDYRADDIVACPSELGWLLPVASTFLYAFSHGLTVVLYDGMGGKFDPRRWFGLFAKYRVSNFTAAPTVYRMLMADGEAARDYDLSSWRHAVSAGEALPADTLAAIERHFGVRPLDGIGMSECMVYCFNGAGHPIKPGSCGRPGPGTAIELLDDAGVPVAPGEDGVLCVRRDSHPGMMQGYWNKPDRTAEVFRGPWYYSGDVLSRDADGYFWFKGRNDDVIKASGYRISPFEVESCLVAHEAVLEAAVVASPDAQRGAVVKAFIVLRAGCRPSPELAEDIRAHVRNSAAPYKCPRRLEFVESLPKTPSGKIKRRELREREMKG
jgi:acetyl-CoA synthetase